MKKIFTIVMAFVFGFGLTVTGAEAQVKYFNATGSFTDGATLSGILGINTTLGTVVSSTLKLSVTPGAVYNLITSQGYNTTDAVYLVFTNSSTTSDQLRLGILSSSLIGFNGGLFNSDTNPSSTNYVSDYQNAFGTRIDLSIGGLTAAAPEPAMWIMMILGFGIVGFAMRKATSYSDRKFDAKIRQIAAGAVA